MAAAAVYDLPEVTAECKTVSGTSVSVCMPNFAQTPAITTEI